MPALRLRLDALEVESFETRAPTAVVYADYQQSTNDHCTGPTNVIVTCRTCGEDFDTCAYTCEETCEYSCEASCIQCWTGDKRICLD